MLQISRFFGIVIFIYYLDHAPSHFHAKYGEHECKISIMDLSVPESELPSRALGLVIEWASMHRSELEDNWRRMKANEP